MKLLAIETSTTLCSIALQIDDQISVQNQDLPMQQAKWVLPFIQSLLTTQKIKIKQLDAIVLGCGPGSFTGIRIATSIAQGLAYAIPCPIISISSLAALAQTAFTEFGWSRSLVAMDARVKEAYWAFYQVENNGLVTLQGEEILSKPQHIGLISNPYLTDFNGIGNAWSVYASEIAYKPAKTAPHILPSATGALALARPYYLNQQWSEPQNVFPHYLRNHIADLL